jgi:ribosomal protein S18 acetylase RimI-like enzyme
LENAFEPGERTTSNSLMHTRVLKPKRGPTVLVRPLRRGDVRTVMAMFERLSEQSRRARFNGPKPCLGASELRQLASVDRTRHALVAYVEDDPRPVAIARLVREGRSAEVAFAVADEHQHRGIGSALTAELIADARAAGITEITALVSSNNRAAVALLRRIANVLDISLEGPELAIRAAIG